MLNYVQCAKYLHALQHCRASCSGARTQSQFHHARRLEMKLRVDLRLWDPTDPTHPTRSKHYVFWDENSWARDLEICIDTTEEISLENVIRLG